jgi:hypothetical protein
MEKIIHKLINNFTEGVDTYTHNGSTWLIFSESKQWVIELTEEKTLWYNYNFFKGIFNYVSMDIVENQHYITKWVEDNIINKVSDIRFRDARDNKHQFEDILVNRVKENSLTYVGKQIGCDDAIENGVKETNPVDVMKFFDNKMNDAIENGVKETQFNDNENKSWVEGVIKGGVKVTLNTEYMPTSMVEDIIQSGVKETKTPGKDGNILSTIEWMEENKSTSYTKMIDDVIDNGVKETKVCNYKDPNTNLVYVRWPEDIDEVIYNGTKMINNVIENGVKETKSIGNESPNYPSSVINHIIKEGEKINGTYAGGQRQSEKCKSVVEYGTKNPTD